MELSRFAFIHKDVITNFIVDFFMVRCKTSYAKPNFALVKTYDSLILQFESHIYV